MLLASLSSSSDLSHHAHGVPCVFGRGEPIPAAISKPDLILAADCVYFEPAFPLLVQTLDELAMRDDPEILFCYKKRRKADKRFFTMLRKRFNWVEVNTCTGLPCIIGSLLFEVDDDPEKEEYNRNAISLLRLTRKSH